MHSVLLLHTVFYILFQEAAPSSPLKFSGFWRAMLTLFRMSLGLTDVSIAEIRQTKVAGWIAVYMILFLIISYLLLINFLIATMQHRQDKLLENADVNWKTLVGLHSKKRKWRRTKSSQVCKQRIMCMVLILFSFYFKVNSGS